MIIDSSALLAIILDEPEEQLFLAAIAGAASPRMSAASYLEVALKIDRGRSDGPDPALDAAMLDLGIALVDVTVAHSRGARTAFNRYGHNHPARLNFGDCLTYALAKAADEPLLFKGNDFSRTDLIPAVAPAGNPPNA